MKIPLHIAEKLLRLSHGEVIASAAAKHALIDELVLEGILERKGRIKKTLQLLRPDTLNTYLQNRHGISDLLAYIKTISKDEVLRSELVAAAADSKLKAVRTFKGFLVNCYDQIHARLNGSEITLCPMDGTFHFIYDFEKFVPSPDVTIVGIENPENFRYIQQQQDLFSGIKPLFVSRYPQNQSKDLMKWLQAISNPYLHFGDFDFSGIDIYQNEYKKHLTGKTTFFVPENIDELLKSYGSKERYDNQRLNSDIGAITEKKLLQLIDTIQEYRKGLDQEILIIKR